MSKPLCLEQKNEEQQELLHLIMCLCTANGALVADIRNKKNNSRMKTVRQNEDEGPVCSLT